MDVTLVNQAIIKTMILVLPFAVVAGLTKNPNQKVFSEVFVMLLAKFKLPATVYIPIHNATLPTTDGSLLKIFLIW